MDVQQIVALGATGLGTFVGTWFAVLKQVKKQSDELTAAQGVEAKSLRDRVLMLEHKVQTMEDNAKGSQGRIERIQENLPKYVTSDEFLTYSKTTTEAINGLTEKVGRATGALEAWRTR